MEGRPELRQVLDVLLSSDLSVGSGKSKSKTTKGKAQARILVAESCIESAAIELLEGSYHRVSDKSLARTLREGGWQVVILNKVATTLLRAISEASPALVICTGPLAEDRARQLADLHAQGGPALLGPNARLFVTDSSDALIVAPDNLELKALRRAIGASRLALCPTPPWLLEAVQDEDGHAKLSIVGMIHADALALEGVDSDTNTSWSRWGRSLEPSDERRHVLVPLGLSTIELDDPDPLELERQLGAHMLERFTGATFPSPRVIAAIYRGRRAQDSKERSSPSAAALWSQAARALPRLGHRLQMEAPLPDVPLEVPASTFLAQEAMLRRERVTELGERDGNPDDELDEELVDRAEQVLRASAEFLSEHESKVVLRGYGFEITRQAVANSASGAAAFADRIGYPVVLKALSPDLRRKAEIGAVRLDLGNAASVRRAHADIISRVEREAPLARLDGVVVAEMVGPGLEFRCGGLRRGDGEGVAFYACPVISGQSIEPALFPGPLAWHEALELALAALQRLPTPALRRASDPRVEQLARVLAQLSQLFERTGTRLRAVHLDPVRLLRDGERAYAVLDASIEQEAHLEGS